MPDLAINFPYTALDLTEAVDRLPNVYGRLQAAGLATKQPSRSTLVEIKRRGWEIVVLAATERGAPGVVGNNPTEKAVYLKIPHFNKLDLITPQDIQDWSAFAAQPRPKTIDDSLVERLEQLRMTYNLTWEYLHAGMIKGEIYDGAGELLYDLYEVFDFTKSVIYFDLDTDETDVKAKCRAYLRQRDNNLKGEVTTGATAYVGTTFFDKLTNHPSVKEHYLQWSAAKDRAELDDREGFLFGGIMFIEYNAPVTLQDGTSTNLIAPTKGHAVPLGTRNTFRNFVGPSDTVDGANQVGPDIFVSPEILKHGKGIELYSESNVLPICQRPELLAEFDAGAEPG
jgi:hypothetical protein